MVRTESVPLTDADRIKELERDMKKLRNKLADYALALSLLQEAAEQIIDSGAVVDESWWNTRWQPGLRLLRLSASLSGESEDT